MLSSELVGDEELIDMLNRNSLKHENESNNDPIRFTTFENFNSSHLHELRQLIFIIKDAIHIDVMQLRSLELAADEEMQRLSRSNYDLRREISDLMACKSEMTQEIEICRETIRLLNEQEMLREVILRFKTE